MDLRSPSVPVVDRLCVEECPVDGVADAGGAEQRLDVDALTRSSAKPVLPALLAAP